MSITKGILLAGGTGSRLHPVTCAVSKQLLPIYDKPMVYYPLTTLMLAGIREVLVITRPGDAAAFEALLGDGGPWGMRIGYAPQPRPRGIGEALLLAGAFLDGDGAALVLGDNLFYGQGMRGLLETCAARDEGATVFGYPMKDPSAYGVAEFDAEGRVVGLEEKPRAPKSAYAVAGLYFYDDRAVEYAEALEPSERGELEITDLNRRYLEAGALRLEKLGRGVTWLDTGTPDSLLQASNFIQTIQERQGLMVASPEEVAYRQGWIDGDALARLAAPLANTAYGRYLASLVDA